MKTAMIRKALLSTLAASAVMVATPALAQNVSFSIGIGSPAYGAPYGYGQGYGHGGQDLRYKSQRVAQQIDRLSYSGRISRAEAYRLSLQLRQLQNLEYRYARNGLSRGEYADLNYRLDRLQQQVRYERRDRW